MLKRVLPKWASTLQSADSSSKPIIRIQFCSQSHATSSAKIKYLVVCILYLVAVRYRIMLIVLYNVHASRQRHKYYCSFCHWSTIFSVSSSAHACILFQHLTAEWHLLKSLLYHLLWQYNFCFCLCLWPPVTESTM